MTNVLFIINKKSGTRYVSLEDDIAGWGRVNAIKYEIEFTQYPKHATEIARQQAAGFDVIVAVGGDGTINEVAQGLTHTSSALGIIPCGSGNGLARHLKISLQPAKALKQLSSGTQLIDTLLVNGHFSVNLAGIGFDGHIAHLFGKSGKRGFSSYAKIVFQEFFNYQENEYQLEIDGEKSSHKLLMLSIANSGQFGNNAVIAPQASMCDSLLDICLVKKIPVYQTPVFACQLFSEKAHRSPFVKIKKAKSLKIKSASPLPLHVDGEPREINTDFEVSILPQSLRVISPSEKI